MANSKRRCRLCRQYFPPSSMVGSGVSVQCSTCVSLPAVRTPLPTPKPKPRRRRKNRQGNRGGKGAPPELKKAIRKRDGHRCRYCSDTTWLQVHHIKYLSQGGPNHESNLIALCDDHHALVHSDKKIWQPILLACIWMEYVEGEMLTVPQMSRRLRLMGLHPEQMANA